MSNRQEIESTTDFVEETMTRAELLELLAEQPRNARVLADQLGMSRSTVHRVTETLTDLGLVEKPDDRFEMTGLGHVVAQEIRGVRTNLETAEQLAPFLNTIDAPTVDLPLERFDRVTVTTPRNRQAHVGVKRIIELIEATDTLRIFSSIISPLYVDVALREIVDGTEIEVIFDREVMEIITARYNEEARKALETGRFRILVGEDIPFELFLFDDRMGMAAHDESGIARAFVESPSPEAREWARNIYEDYAQDAEPLDVG